MIVKLNNRFLVVLADFAYEWTSSREEATILDASSAARWSALIPGTEVS